MEYKYTGREVCKDEEVQSMSSIVTGKETSISVRHVTRLKETVENVLDRLSDRSYVVDVNGQVLQ